MSAFNALKAKLAAQGAKDPGGLAYSIGAKKFSPGVMHQASAKKESVQAVLRQRRGGK